ncbi:MAG: AAA family ATPase [Flavobacteriales bacterium]|nr:AAA family ATPase [Flavobacteriales bacterium]
MGKAENSAFKKHKFRELKTYCSTEWLSDGKKKYRRVFNNSEISYLYAELSFFNKLFDEENWTAKILIECVKEEGDTEVSICKINLDREVKTDENIVYIREGWGNASYGVFWKKGKYTWKAYIDDEYVGSSIFYVENELAVTPENNPFFEVVDLRIFEGPNGLPPEGDRKYYTCYQANETRYIWGEFKIKSKLDYDFQAEIFYTFFNDAGQLKGYTSELVTIRGGETTVCSGWGSDTKGTWYNDAYRLEISFMETLLAWVPFEVGATFEEGFPKISNGIGGLELEKKEAEINQESLDELLAKMDELIGMDNIKTKIRDYVKYLNFLKLREEKGFKENKGISLHAVLTGNPGTGKTTIAKQLGKIYKEMGLLTKGHVHEVDRSDLVAEYIGQTAPRTKAAIEKARGGILFIDEAYSLHRSGEDSKDFGREVIEILLKEMSDGPGNIAVVVAGYPQEMKGFLESNPGLKSRFNHYFQFEDYIPEELMEIADLGLKQRGLFMQQDAKEFLFTKFTQAYRDRERSFGNARFVMSVVDEGKMNMGLRLMQNSDVASLSEEELSTITKEDIYKIFAMGVTKTLDLRIDEKQLKDALQELNELVGLHNVKDEITELVKLVKYYKEIGKDVLNKFVLHSVFVGNPGTGKTTVARIFAKIFRALGILEKGHLVECDREGMVAGYSGQTATKTSNLIEQSMGGVLFIDEAYALHQGRDDQFGMEAINTLLKRMEDNRDDFVVIAAGYTDNMNEFLMTNPGLRSRFERVFQFEDYKPEELMKIADFMLKAENMKADQEAMEHLQAYFTALWNVRDKFYGNAREVRKVIGEAIKNQNLRMASMDAKARTMEMVSTLTKADVEEFSLDKIKGQQTQGGKPLGFRIGG